MSGPESVEPTKQPKLINATALVDLLQRAGPASDVRVRVHFKGGSTKLGILKYGDDRIGSGNGPVIVILNEEDPDKEGELIPLGGHTIYSSPPRVSSLDSARSRPILFGETTAHRMPTHAMAEELLFEVINEK